MKMNTKKIAVVMEALILMTVCGSAQGQLPQTIETVPSVAVTVLQRGVQSERTPDTTRTDRLAEQTNSTCAEAVLPVQEPAEKANAAAQFILCKSKMRTIHRRL